MKNIDLYHGSERLKKIKDNLNMHDSYIARFFMQLRQFGIHNLNGLQYLDKAPIEIQRSTLSYFAELAFESQSATNIVLGRMGFKKVPISWLITQLDKVLAVPLASNDEWEYMRITELLSELDGEVLEKHLSICENHSDANIRQFAREYRENEPHAPLPGYELLEIKQEDYVGETINREPDWMRS